MQDQLLPCFNSHLVILRLVMCTTGSRRLAFWHFAVRFMGVIGRACCKCFRPFEVTKMNTATTLRCTMLEMQS